MGNLDTLFDLLHCDLVQLFELVALFDLTALTDLVLGFIQLFFEFLEVVRRHTDER